MDVSCPACAAKYTADAEKLRGKTARMRCKACNTAWLVSGPGANANASPVSMMPPALPPPASIPPASSEGEARLAAVMKTGNDREKRDLFAERAPDVGSVRVKDTLLPPPSFGFTGTASRNETSVLFRVDQLANVGGRIKTPEPERFDNVNIVKPAESRSGGDEEGVIDLKQLASVPPGKRSIIPVAPLFSEPPPMTMEVGSTGSRAAIAKPISKGKLVAAIAAAAAFLVVAGLGLSVAFKGEEAVQRTAAVAPPPPPAVPVTAAPTADPAPLPSTAANDDDQPKKKKGKRKGKAVVSGPTPAQKKAADPCGCKGDFHCILACTAKNGK